MAPKSMQLLQQLWCQRAMRPDLRDLTDHHLLILGALWTMGKGTIAEIHDAISGEHEITTKTIATLLGRLEKRGVVSKETVGREGVYEPNVTRRAVLVSRIGGALAAVFAAEDDKAIGTAAVSQRHVREGDDEKLRALLKRAERDLRK
jgi:BlaI family penicillinase repressor